MQAQIFNAAGNQAARVLPWGNLQVAIEGRAVFSEPFEGTVLDTVNRWNTPVVAGTGAVVVSLGGAALTVGTGASSAVAISSIENFAGVGASFLQYATVVKFEAGSTLTNLLPLNNNSFFGQGTPNGSYTAATPLTDAIGFERTIDGKVSCVVYSGTARIPVKEITSSVVDGGYHLMGLAVRGDTKYFFLDNLEVPVASVPLLSPTTMNLPIRVHSINHTSGPTVGPTFQITGVQVLDSGGTYPIVFNGQTVSRQRAPNVFKTFSLTSVATETAIWTPAAGKKFRLMGYQLTSGTVGGDVVLKDGTGLATIMTIPFGAAAGSSQTAPPLGNGILSGAINRVLTATGVATQTISGYVFGCEE